MTTVETTVEIDAPPERVWDVVSDPRNLPRWDRRIGAVEGVPPEGLSPGASYTTVLRFMAVHATVHVQVLEWEPPKRSVTRLTGLLDGTVSTSVTALPAGRSRLKHVVEYRFRGGPLGELAARSLRIVGGAGFALRHGTLAQVRQIEREGS